MSTAHVIKNSQHQHVLSISPDNEVRFHNRHETVDVSKFNRFQIWTTAELKGLLGREIVVDDEGRPILIGPDEPKMIKVMALMKDEILDNPNISRKVKYKAIRKLQLESRQQDAEEAKKAQRVDPKNARVEIGEWLQRPLTLGRPDGSALDRMRSEALDGRLFIISGRSLSVMEPEIAESLVDVQSFVVGHNWAGAISEAEIVGDGAGELGLPFPATCFEFMVAGKRTMALIYESPDDAGRMRFSPIVKVDDGWAILMNYFVSDDWKPIAADNAATDVVQQFQPLADLLVRNAWAICVMLEAKVVEREVVRIDAKLNQTRARRGKLPLHDYHVVAIRRDRVTPRSPAELDPDRDITRKRWHLVRSHWRQYSDHRTRIDWHSRGDIDLGVIDKHYKL